MDLVLNTALEGLRLGLCYAVAALGMYIAYSILDFPDLTADGSFPLGAAVATILIYRLNFPPVIALLGGALAGALAGTVTGVLHVRFGVTKLLSGIITMTGLLSGTLILTLFMTRNGYSVVNFSYIPNKINGLFNTGAKVLPGGVILLILALFCVAVKILLDLFFRTKLGFLLTATGNNERLVTSLGKDAGACKIIGLAMTNGLVALSGGLYAQMDMQYDNTCGSGKVVLTLASIIIGTALLSKVKFVKPTTAVILGAILYSLCLHFFTLLDTNGLYLKLMNAIFFAVILVFDHRIKRPKVKKAVLSPTGKEAVSHD